MIEGSTIVGTLALYGFFYWVGGWKLVAIYTLVPVAAGVWLLLGGRTNGRY